VRFRVSLTVFLLVGAGLFTAHAADDVNALLARARELESQKQWSAALAVYEDILEDDPTNTTALYRRGVGRDSIGATEMAIASYKEALRHDPNMKEAREALEGHYVTQGYSARAAGRRDDAIAKFRQAVEANPDGHTGRLELGQELEARGDLSGAAAEYEAAARAHSDDATAHARLAAIAAKQGSHERAAREFAEVVRLTPRDPVGHRGLAVAYEALGRRDDALAATQQAIRFYMLKGLEDKAIEMTRLESKLLAAGARVRATPRPSARGAPDESRDD